MSSSSSYRQHRRQRRSVARTVVTTAAVAYGAYQLWLWNSNDEEGDGQNSGGWGSWFAEPAPQRQSQQTIDPRTQWKLRRRRIQKCRTESIQACQTCWPSLLEKIEDKTNTSAVTRKLKDLRASQDGHNDDLWKEIYVETVTRFLTSVYAHTLWLCMSTVQIHYIGGRLFRKEPPLEAEEKSMLVESHHYLLRQGLDLLIPIIRRTVQPLLEDWKARSTITTKDLHARIAKAQRSLDSTFSSKETKYARNWIRFVLPDETVDEVWDISRSPVWDDAHHQLLQETMQVLLILPDDDLEVPVAKHMAPLKKACQMIASEDNHQRWISLPTLLELGDVSFQH
eukprot:scaffold1624_cov105-Cylindrotheca_fusiformis.AAC.5